MPAGRRDWAVNPALNAVDGEETARPFGNGKHGGFWLNIKCLLVFPALKV